MAAQDGRLPAGLGGHIGPEVGTEGHVQASGGSGCGRSCRPPGITCSAVGADGRRERDGKQET